MNTQEQAHETAKIQTSLAQGYWVAVGESGTDRWLMGAHRRFVDAKSTVATYTLKIARPGQRGVVLDPNGVEVWEAIKGGHLGPLGEDG